MGHLAHTPENFQRILKAIPHKERLATLHAICLQISLQSLFRIFPHASCVHIFRDISGKYSKIHKGFSPFFPSSLKKSDDAICIRQIRNRLSYFTKMLVNTSSIHSAFCFIWRKIWRRICRTIFVRYCLYALIVQLQFFKMDRTEKIWKKLKICIKSVWRLCRQSAKKPPMHFLFQIFHLCNLTKFENFHFALDKCHEKLYTYKRVRRF